MDYVFGVEVGLDTNARKNRSGHVMEKRVDSILTKAGIDHEAEVSSSTIPEIDKVLGEATKRINFVIRTTSKTYLMKANF